MQVKPKPVNDSLIFQLSSLFLFFFSYVTLSFSFFTFFNFSSSNGFFSQPNHNPSKDIVRCKIVVLSKVLCVGPAIN